MNVTSWSNAATCVIAFLGGTLYPDAGANRKGEEEREKKCNGLHPQLDKGTPALVLSFYDDYRFKEGNGAKGMA